MRRLVIAGLVSGVGKTTIACALLAAYRRRGWRVQPFKAGPDYIDPSHHALAAGLPSRNLDSFLLPADSLRALFAQAAARADLALVEGVMGLFDGLNGRDEVGSTAEVAKLLDAPVVVVLDVSSTARTAGAMALGIRQFDPDLRLIGFILNGVGSDLHRQWATESIEGATGLPVLGAFPRRDDFRLPERHLGLVPTVETRPPEEFYARLAFAAEESCDLDRLWRLAEAASPPLAAGASPFPPEPQPVRARLAVARDEAFSFYYEDSLDLLAAWGAELLPFSPLRDRSLPEGAQGIYLGGGFPELYARELAENRPMLATVRQAATRRMPIYGECGGLMYLGQALRDFDGRRYPMVGLVPVESAMTREHLTLGYRTATALRHSPLLMAGHTVRGHEFHWSQLTQPVPSSQAAYSLAELGGASEGYAAGSVLASYVHLHFGSNGNLAQRLVTACAATPRWEVPS